MEAAPGFEPGMTVLQTVALPLGYAASAGGKFLIAGGLREHNRTPGAPAGSRLEGRAPHADARTWRRPGRALGAR